MIHHALDLPRGAALALLTATWWHGAIVGALVAAATVRRGAL